MKKNKLAKVISYLLHPLFMPIYSFFLLFHYNTYLNYSIAPIVKKVLYTIIFFNTIIAPASISYFLVKKGTIKSIEMDTKEERLIPFLTTSIFFIFSCILLYSFPVPRIFFLIILGATISVILAFFINISWKISTHMIGIGGVIGILLGMSQRMLIDLQMPVIVGFLCVGILGSARLKLEAHTPMQIYSGFLIGFFVEFFLLIR